MNLEIISREPLQRIHKAPLLFVHGTGHAAWCWDQNFLPFFADLGFSAHAVSLRGHGKSDGREKLKWTSIADYVDDVHNAASSLDQPPVLLGHSLGALVALKYLENYSAPAAVLIAPSPSEGMLWSGLRLQFQNPWIFAKIAARQDYAVMFSTPELAKKFLFSAEMPLDEVATHSTRFGSESYRAALELIFNLPVPSRVKAPLLVIGAENDALIARSKIEKTAQAFEADLKIFPNMAHDIMLEHGWRDAALYIAEWLRNKPEAGALFEALSTRVRPVSDVR